MYIYMLLITGQSISLFCSSFEILNTSIHPQTCLPLTRTLEEDARLMHGVQQLSPGGRQLLHLHVYRIAGSLTSATSDNALELASPPGFWEKKQSLPRLRKLLTAVDDAVC